MAVPWHHGTGTFERLSTQAAVRADKDSRHTFRPGAKVMSPTFEPMKRHTPQGLRRDSRHTFWPITLELTDLPQMDPRVLKATSVKADPTAPATAEPQALKITAASSNPKMFTLPWEKPLATWPDELLANLPRGISRHVVRFVHVGDSVYAIKEITRNVAEREYELLRRLEKLELPTCILSNWRFGFCH